MGSRGGIDEPNFSCTFDAGAGAGVIPAEVLDHVGDGTAFERSGMNFEEVELNAGNVLVAGRFDLMNAARNATPVFIVQ